MNIFRRLIAFIKSWQPHRVETEQDKRDLFEES